MQDVGLVTREHVNESQPGQNAGRHRYCERSSTEGQNMDWRDFGQQQRPFDQSGPADASANWVERVTAAEASIQQQAGNQAGMLDALAKLFLFRLQNRRG
jgi:hypothetical protein